MDNIKILSRFIFLKTMLYLSHVRYFINIIVCCCTMSMSFLLEGKCGNFARYVIVYMVVCVYLTVVIYVGGRSGRN